MKRYEITCSVNPDDVLFETDVYENALTELTRRAVGSQRITFEMYNNELTEAIFRSTPGGTIVKVHPTHVATIKDWEFEEIDSQGHTESIVIKAPTYSQALKIYKQFRHPEKENLSQVVLAGHIVVYDHRGYL